MQKTQKKQVLTVLSAPLLKQVWCMKIAEKSGCPVVPVAALHTADVLENHFPRIKATHVVIRFGTPIDLKSLSREERKFAGAYVRSIISGMLTDMISSEQA